MVLHNARGPALIWTWDAAIVLSAVFALALLRPLVPQFEFSVRTGLGPFLREGRLMLAYQLSWLGGWLPVFAFPILVVALRGPRENAYFYFTWSIGAVFFMVSTSISAALFAEGSNGLHDVHRQARLALKASGLILLPMVLLTLVFAHQILLLFGTEYADHGATLLRICALGALPDAVTNTYVAVRQAQRRLRSAVGLNLAMAFLALGLAAVLLPSWGINGVGWSWTAAQLLGSMWVGWQFLRGRREPSEPAPRLDAARTLSAGST
jgi:O-antigen/teichoic acid export membrane protein